MKVKKLIALLERCDPDAEVEAYDPEDAAEASVTGIVHSVGRVTLWTDEL